MNFNERLKKIRTERGLSLDALAVEVGITKQAIHKYEKGFMSPQPPVLAEIARVLGVTTDYLCGLTDEQ